MRDAVIIELLLLLRFKNIKMPVVFNEYFRKTVLGILKTTLYSFVYKSPFGMD